MMKFAVATSTLCMWLTLATSNAANLRGANEARKLPADLACTEWGQCTYGNKHGNWNKPGGILAGCCDGPSYHGLPMKCVWKDQDYGHCCVPDGTPACPWTHYDGTPLE
ncbi:unnamed protein product [Chrysoparadoxa australica]